MLEKNKCTVCGKHMIPSTRKLLVKIALEDGPGKRVKWMLDVPIFVCPDNCQAHWSAQVSRLMEIANDTNGFESVEYEDFNGIKENMV